MKFKTILLAVAISLSLYAEIDITPYNLSSAQVEILRNMEAKKKFSDEWLQNFAMAMHNSNLQRERQANTYIPPYTQQELEDTIVWARGGAFSAFAQYADMTFDGESYREDCPNVGLFRFARASGTEYIPVDIMREAINQSFYLQHIFSSDKENFKKKFLEEAQKYDMLKYLIPIATEE